MSAIRLAKPTAQASSGLRAINGGKLQQLLGQGKSKSRLAIALTVIVGLVAIQLLQLVLNVALGTSTYALASLKAEKKQLVLQQQILAEQVDSLSSNQNLANTAQKMGMVSNANPVFLRLSDQRVFGKPKAALNADNRLSRNLIPSAVMTVTSNLSETTDSTAAAEASSLVPNGQLQLVTVGAAQGATTVSNATAVATQTKVPAATSTGGLSLVTVKTPTSGLNVVTVKPSH